MTERRPQSPDNQPNDLGKRERMLANAIYRSSNAVVHFDSGSTAIDPLITYMALNYPDLQTTVIDLSTITNLQQLDETLRINRDENGDITQATLDALGDQYVIFRHFGKFVRSHSDTKESYEENTQIFSLLRAVTKYTRVMLTYDDGVLKGEYDEVLRIARDFYVLDCLLRDHAVIDIVV